MNYNFPVAFFDPPQILDAAVTPIPGAGDDPLEVISNIGTRSAVAIDFIDTTGQFIGVYIGPEGEERLVCIIGNGLNGRAWAVFAANSRVSIRSMNADEITQGTLCGTLMGY